MPTKYEDYERHIFDFDVGQFSISGEEARINIKRAADEVASLVRSTLGPRGLENLIQTWNLQDEPENVRTADTGELLRAIERGDGFTHPVAALLVDSVDAMSRGLSDGTTSAILLADALIDEGYKLIDMGLHPNTIAVGYAMAATRTGAILDLLIRDCDSSDREMLRQVAMTAITTDIETNSKNIYADQIADVICRLGDVDTSAWIDTDNVKVLSTTHRDDHLHRGVVIRRKPSLSEESSQAPGEFDWTLDFPDRKQKPTVALLDDEIDFQQTATNFETGVSINSLDAFNNYKSELDSRIAEVASYLRQLNVDVLVSQSNIDDPIQSAFKSQGIVVIDRVEYPLTDIYRLAKATNANVRSDIQELTTTDLGTSGNIVEYRVGDEKWTIFDDCPGNIFTLVIQAGTESGRSWRKRAVENALDVTAVASTDQQVLPGAGAPAMAAATGLHEYAPTISGREALAIKSFADALETIPSALATNAGYDPIDALSSLRAAHADTKMKTGRTEDMNPAPIGISVISGEPIDAWNAGIVEPRRVFSQAIETARTIAVDLLTIDTILYPGVDFDSFVPEAQYD